MITADLVVVGAGPAGAAAAITACRAGLSVRVVDRAVFPRDKCCGDGLTAGALRSLADLGLDRSEVASWTDVPEAHLWSPSGRHVRLPLHAGRTHAAVARRADLDAALVAAARRAGAQVHEGTRLVSAVADHGAVTVETTAGSYRAPYVVGADGVWSPLRKAVTGRADRPQGYLGEWHALRQYYTGVDGPAAADLWVWFEPELLPAYAWSFPLAGGTANVGIGVIRRPGLRTGTMGALWDAVVARPHIRALLGRHARPESPRRAWPIPTRLERRLLTAAGGRILFAGDAARAADPMTGEGIGQALETGMAAAGAAARAGPGRPGQAAGRYRAEMAAGLAFDNRFAALLSRGLGPVAGARGAVRLVGSSPWAARNFGRWMFEEYPRALVLTPWRWRLRR